MEVFGAGIFFFSLLVFTAMVGSRTLAGIKEIEDTKRVVILQRQCAELSAAELNYGSAVAKIKKLGGPTSIEKSANSAIQLINHKLQKLKCKSEDSFFYIDREQHDDEELRFSNFVVRSLIQKTEGG